ncbi:phosphatidate cytidylyltransferase [Arcanobacterium phocisimile]|uniref:Phosphatidate cytidylyltransferase n=1 Tax=Arcanobacterium phocisimile TaxID=1302235 RepID=A0ABX7IHU6_9ACTO|nr:phosphatidate cytidylyltransferase [Arcanobacterium phocisimile]QRV02706.1 phosphatidate cytidylyltransferase [Arcanobacterium phocisimile]
MTSPSPTKNATFLSRLVPHPPRPPQEVTSRAGRNVPAAVATGLGLLGLVGLSLAYKMEIFVALAIAFLVVGIWEIAGAFLARNIRIPFIPLIIGGVGMMLATWSGGLRDGLIVFFFAAGVAMLWRTYMAEDHVLTDGIAGVFALAWIGIFSMFAVALAALSQGAFAVIAFVLLPVASDTGGWLAGINFGKHPIAPSISPKKSWEGYIGSTIGALLAALVTVWLGLGLPWYAAVIIGLTIPIFATAGDFSESLLKRDLGVKDMGSIFPGHGGVLDRVDSLLFCAPILYVILTYGFGLN